MGRIKSGRWCRYVTRWVHTWLAVKELLRLVRAKRGLSPRAVRNLVLSESDWRAGTHVGVAWAELALGFQVKVSMPMGLPRA